MAETHKQSKTADPYGGDSDSNWCTPRYVLDVIEGFCPIGLDPCSNVFSLVNSSYRTLLPDDGLLLPWHLFGAHTFVNPPYSAGQIKLWTAKALREFELGANHITMLINVCPETEPWHANVWGGAHCVGMWKKRIKFVRPDGGTQAKLSSALVYWGTEPEGFAEHFREHATVITEWRC